MVDVDHIPTMLDELEQMRRELARRSLLNFVLYNDDRYMVGRHHKMIAEQLEATLRDVVAIRNGEMREEDSDNLRLMIFAPPRHGKSRMVSQEFPVWAIGNHPWMGVMLTSYSADLVREFGLLTRNKMRDNEQLFDVSLAEDMSRADRWMIQGGRAESGVMASAVGGQVTGKGAHIAIIDDPVKNYDEAASLTMRNRNFNWWLTALRTRLAPGGAVIVIMTRWHQDDLAGRMLKYAENDDLADQWKVLNFTAEAEEDDLLGRAPGEPLWPERYGKKSLTTTRASMGSYMYNAMYQGHPSPPDGTMFKRKDFRYWEIENGTYVLHRDEGDERFAIEQCWHFQTCDPTSSSKSDADYFAGATWIVTPRNDLLLYDMSRYQMEGAQQPRLIIDLYRRYTPEVVGIEVNGVGNTIFQIVRDQGVPVHEFRASTDKLTRAIPMGAKYEAHKVFHMMGASWLGEYEEELTTFPHGAHDDQVDAASYAAILHAEITINTKQEATISASTPYQISPY